MMQYIRDNITAVYLTDANGTPTAVEMLDAQGASLLTGTSISPPNIFATNQWSVTTGSAPNQININVSVLPANNGSAITAIHYRIGAGAWVALPSAATGSYPVSMAAPATEYSISLRAVNITGPGEPSVAKTVTSGALPQVALTVTPAAGVVQDAAIGSTVATIATDATSTTLGGTDASLLQISGTNVVTKAALTGKTDLSFTVNGTRSGYTSRQVSVSVDVAASGAGPAGTLWIGDYDSSSVTVTASAIDGVDTVRLAAVPTSGGATITTGALTVDPTYRFARATITGLSAGVDYTIRLQTTAGTNIGDAGWCKTRPTTRQAFQLGFASCGDKNRPQAIYDTIYAQNPNMQAFLHLGDRGYPDITVNNVANYHAHEDTLLAMPEQGRFHRRPVIYMWDDHDFGADSSNANSAIRPAALEWFRGRVPARPYSATATVSPYRSWSPMPGVKVAIVDARSDRTSNSAIISAAQEAWLIGEIQSLAAEEILVFASMVPWCATSGTDNWNAATAIRDRIAAAITQYAPGRVFAIAGDGHMLAFDSGVNSPAGIPVFQAAPLGRTNSVKGGPYSGGTVTATEMQYGLLDFTPITGGWTVTYKGFSVDAAGVQTQRLTHTATLQAPAGVAPAFTGTSSIAGGTAEGATLTANAGTFTGTPTPTVGYQWRIDGVNVSGATSQTFTRPSGADKVPSVIITLTNGVNPPATRTVTGAATTAPQGDATATYRSAVLAQSPQFLLLNPGATSIPDESPNGRNATIVGTQGSQVATGPFGLPVFRGTATCHAELAHVSAFDSGDWTVLLWLHNGSATGANLHFYSRGDGVKLAHATNSSFLADRYEPINSGSVENGIGQNVWNFAAMTYSLSSGTGRTYTAIDGGDLALRSERIVPGSAAYATTDPITFNGRKIGATVDRRAAFAFAGMSRFAKAMTQAEIAAIYNATRAAA